jgi:hypothetical protein
VQTGKEVYHPGTTLREGFFIYHPMSGHYQRGVLGQASSSGLGIPAVWFSEEQGGAPAGSGESLPALAINPITCLETPCALVARVSSVLSSDWEPL